MRNPLIVNIEFFYDNFDMMIAYCDLKWKDLSSDIIIHLFAYVYSRI